MTLGFKGLMNGANGAPQNFPAAVALRISTGDDAGIRRPEYLATITMRMVPNDIV